MKSFKKQKGFSILAMLLMTVVIMVAIGSWMLSGNNNIVTSSNNSLDVQINSLINDASNIQSAFDRIAASGVPTSNITFIPYTASVDPKVNIFDPATGIQPPVVNQNLIKPGNTSYWVYMQKARFNNTFNKIIIFLPGITDKVCKRINYLLHDNPTIMSSTMYSSSILFNTTPANPYNNITYSIPTTFPYNVGCYGYSAYPDNNWFYRILN